MNDSSADLRTIFLSKDLEIGQRQLREVMAGLFVSLNLSPPKSVIWISSPWISDFLVVDDPSLPYKQVSSWWCKPRIYFSDALASVVNVGGAKIHIVLRSDTDTHSFSNHRFLERLKQKVIEPGLVRYAEYDDVHIKGLVTDNLRITGSMNFTFSGTSINDEWVQVDSIPSQISEMRLTMESQYAEKLVFL